MKIKNYSGLSIALIALFSISCGGGGSSGGGVFPGEAASSAVTFSSGVDGNIDSDGDGTAFISYVLTFPYGTSLDVTIEYSLDGGKSYADCAENTANRIGGQDNPSEGLTNLSATPTGEEHVFAWDVDSVQALQNQNANWILVRITTEEGARTVSQYLTVTYNSNDSDAPTITKLSAVAKEGASNDTIRIVYSEPVDETEATKRSNFIVKNPAATLMPIPTGSTIEYDPILKRTTITLDGSGTANLQFGEDCTVRVKNVTDLAGNAIVNGAGDSLTSQVNGDGANLPDDQPMLQLVYFDGAGGPSAGEYMCMIFDEEIALNPAATFDDNDVDFFDGGDRLGTNSPIGIELLDAFTVQVTLGTSPVFTPSASRINIPDVNDKITDLAGNKPYMNPAPGRNDYELIISYDTTRPRMDLVTLNEIPDILNGKGDAGGELLVPKSKFDIYLEYHDVGGAGVDTQRVEIISTRDVTYDGSNVTANTDLVPYLTERSKNAESALYYVPAKMVFPIGDVTIKARVWDLLDNASTYRQFSFEVTAKNNIIRPFETQVNPNQRWNLIFTRDLYTITSSGSPTITVTAIETSNGTPDFREDMLVLGFRSDSPVNVPGTG
ncbi:MAG: Ig-like domain-containing domain, partial [Planctomycetota bacterium]